MRNIVLIGMPGCGKSTVGVVLAKALGMDFVDSDLVIQSTMGATLAQLIEQHGDDGFRDIENRVNASIDVQNSIIATGGSVVYGAEAMAHLMMAALGVSYERPRGGVYIWCRLPDGVDSKRFINRAYNMGLILIPGYVFYPFKNGGRNYVRINYSYESDERLLAGMEVFRAALLESLEG